MKRSNTVGATPRNPVIMESLSTDDYGNRESANPMKTLFENKSLEMPPKDLNASLSAGMPIRKVSISSMISIKKVIGLKNVIREGFSSSFSKYDISSLMRVKMLSQKLLSMKMKRC